MKNKVKKTVKWWVYGMIFAAVLSVLWVWTTDLMTAWDADSWFGWNNVYKWWHLTRNECIKLNGTIMVSEVTFFAWLFGWKWDL